MKNKVNPYKKENDICVESVSTQEILVMNPQKSHVTLGDGFGGTESEYDQLIIVFSAADPCPPQDRVPVTFDPNEPLVIAMDHKESVDHLIATLQKLRNQIWGMTLSLDTNKN
jgi:hypothetical protein